MNPHLSLNIPTCIFCLIKKKMTIKILKIRRVSREIILLISSEKKTYVVALLVLIRSTWRNKKILTLISLKRSVVY